MIMRDSSFTFVRVLESTFINAKSSFISYHLHTFFEQLSARKEKKKNKQKKESNDEKSGNLKTGSYNVFDNKINRVTYFICIFIISLS